MDMSSAKIELMSRAPAPPPSAEIILRKRSSSVGGQKECGKSNSACVGNGRDFIIDKCRTNLHQLDGLFMKTHPSSFLLLNEPGQGHFQNNSSVSVYLMSPDGLVKERSFEVCDRAGFFSLSDDGTLLAVGVLKDDIVRIYDMNSGELLLNFAGGQKWGYMGSLQFYQDATKNKLAECRVVDMEMGRPAHSVLRMWELGNLPNNDSTDSDRDSDVDDVEAKSWENHMQGEVSFAVVEDGVVTTHTKSNCLEWLHLDNGSVHKIVETGESWTSKTIVSSLQRYVAVSHFGCCCIYDLQTGIVAGKVITSKDLTDAYPLTPIKFFGKADEWLLLRNNSERIVVLCNWRLSVHDMVTFTNVGGTISDNCIMLSPDEEYLVCWPFGYLEIYNFFEMKRKLFSKVSIRLKWECISLRELLLQQRASLILDRTGFSSFLRLMLGVQIYDVFRYIINFL